MAWLGLTLLAALGWWRLGAARVLLALAVLWAGWVLAALWAGGLDERATGRLALGAVLLPVGAYALLIGALRRRAARAATPRPGEIGARPGPAARLAAPAQPPAPAPDIAPPADPEGPLTDPELDRYARHIVLRELGGAGQRRLRAARVLVVGAGGLGAPVLSYLAAAGVGRITVADDDTVGLSNLQRQVIFATADIGRPKVRAAADAMARLNPHVAVTPLARRITADDAALVGAHDLVLDGTDSFAARAAVNAACVAAGVPLIAGSIAQWEGQVALYDPARGGPCMACLFPAAPAPGLALSCAEAGVVGALPGVVGSMMAIEAIKHLSGIPDSGAGSGLRGRMVLFDGLWGETRSIATRARPGCAVCGGTG
ncbi:HesA/MoeB/ThiF family protein [Paracoccus luteus]|uniref:HesA/MoeB/ThiF family protein n=1 Tax=Paracoccus luteus TaxID=2508543 RepID=UPI00106F20F8|nr:molybdopterin-synthase adenylyltransferase MoeB [Paracoccus luteus]